MTSRPSSTREALNARCDTLRKSPAYKAYLTTRDAVLRYLDLMAFSQDSSTQLSDYWAEESSGFDYLFDASPLLIEKLRHHTYHVTGLKVYDYRTGKDRERAGMAAKIALLEQVAGNRDLLVPEEPALGGFGHTLDGALYNIDTLKFWEVMICLERGAVLDALRAKDRPMVIEIGAGWGGFAHVFRTLIPGSTYVIIDLPGTMLFSGTYLSTLHPEASIRYLDPAAPPSPAELAETDILMVPHFAIDALIALRPDLVLNMVSFQEMTAEQVRNYVDLAWRLESPFLYSLNRERSPYNPQMNSVSELITEKYNPVEFSILDIPYTRLPASPGPDSTTDKENKKKAKTEKKKSHPITGPRAIGTPFKGTSYRHLVGWRKSSP